MQTPARSRWHPVQLQSKRSRWGKGGVMPSRPSPDHRSSLAECQPLRSFIPSPGPPSRLARRRLRASHVAVIPMASKPSGAGRERCPARPQLAGILHPSAALWHRSASAICGSSQNCSSTSDCGGPSLQVIEPLSQSDRACNPLHRTLLSVRPLSHRSMSA